MIKTPKTITIVGAGTAGLVAALMLRVRFHNIGIKIVRSKKIGIIGVGEGSTEHWNEFLEFVGINFLEIVAECDATFKCGILFRNWGTQDYMHNLGGDDLSIRVRGAPVAFLKYISEKQPNKIFNSLECWENKLFSASLNPDFPPYNQYHFNTFKLNAFLERKCLERNIDIVDDEIL
jgi:tryptophan halogenase